MSRAQLAACCWPLKAAALLAACSLLSVSVVAETGAGAGNAIDSVRDAGVAAAGQQAKWWPWDWFRRQREERERREREERERRRREEEQRRLLAALPLVQLKTKCGIAARQDRVGYYGGDITCAEKVGGCDKSKGEDVFNQGFASRRVSGTDAQRYQQCAEYCCENHMCYYFSIWRDICYIKRVSGWNYRQDTDITSGHMDRMPASPCVANTTALVDTDFNGGDLHCQRDLGLSNGCVAGTDASRSGVLNYRTFGPPELRFAQCSELCCREPKCKYFSVTDAGACYLKKSMGAAPPGSDDDNGADGSGGDGKKNPGPSGAVAASVAAGRGGGGGGQPNVFSAIGNWLRSGLQRPRRHHRRRRSWWGRFADSQAGNGAEAEDADAAADADAGVAGAAGAASGPASVQIPMELDAKALAITGGVKPLPAAAAAVQQAAAAPAIAAGAGATGAGQEAEGAAALAAVLAHSGAAGHRFIAADTKAAAHAQAGAQVAVQLDVDAGTGQGNAPRRVVHRGGWMSGIKGGLPKTDCAVAPPEKGIAYTGGRLKCGADVGKPPHKCPRGSSRRPDDNFVFEVAGTAQQRYKMCAYKCGLFKACEAFTAFENGDCILRRKDGWSRFGKEGAMSGTLTHPVAPFPSPSPSPSAAASPSVRPSPSTAGSSSPFPHSGFAGELNVAVTELSIVVDAERVASAAELSYQAIQKHFDALTAAAMSATAATPQAKAAAAAAAEALVLLEHRMGIAKAARTLLAQARYSAGQSDAGAGTLKIEVLPSPVSQTPRPPTANSTAANGTAASGNSTAASRGGRALPSRGAAAASAKPAASATLGEAAAASALPPRFASLPLRDALAAIVAELRAAAAQDAAQAARFRSLEMLGRDRDELDGEHEDAAGAAGAVGSSGSSDSSAHAAGSAALRAGFASSSAGRGHGQGRKSSAASGQQQLAPGRAN